MPFAATYYDDRRRALGTVNLRYYPRLDLTQADARSATAQDVRELDMALREAMATGAKTVGMSPPLWVGTHKSSINGITVFITEYLRKALKGSGEVRVRLVRVFSGSKSFTLTVSYHEGMSMFLKPITDQIIRSLSM